MPPKSIRLLLMITFFVQHGGPSKNVAVKIFLQEMDRLENHSISELLVLSKQPKHLLHAYREIRQEVSFLSTLNNPFLTELCGVRTSPYMCLLLELAPKKSLHSMLKEYKECGLTLEPLTLKITALQVHNSQCRDLTIHIIYIL